MRTLDPGNRAALVVSHPGHELRVYEWLRQTQPKVFVLTDGSGRAGVSRLAATTQLLQEIGVQHGNIYGRFSDSQFYAALLAADFAPFRTIVDELATVFATERIHYVVADAAEGYNPAHDVCRLLVDAAVRLTYEQWKWEVASFDFSLVGRPADCYKDRQSRTVLVQLDETAFARKRAAARAYVSLTSEIDALIERLGAMAFRVECLRLVETRFPTQVDWTTKPPFYEQHGESRVTGGYYQQVIRYREHVKPLAEALWRLSV